MAITATNTTARCAAKFVFIEFDWAKMSVFRDAVRNTLVEELEDSLCKSFINPELIQKSAFKTTAQPDPVHSSFYPSNVIHLRIKSMNESGVIPDSLAQLFNHDAIRAFVGITDPTEIDEVIKELNKRLDRIEFGHSPLKKDI